MRKLRVAGIVAALFIGFSLFGGSAIWAMLGLGDNLDIDGRATIVRDLPPEFGNGWTAYGADGFATRFSAASEITPANVSNLEIAWSFRTGALEGRDQELLDRSAFETTPILVEDSLIFCTQFHEIIALNPADGSEKWRFDSEVVTGVYPANQYTCRGVSYWRDTAAEGEPADECSSRIIFGTLDSRVIALDARTGKRCASFGDNGEVRIEPSISLRWPGEFQITSAPAIVGDVVVTGTAIGDNLRTNAPRGTVHAFDIRTGEEMWVFNPLQSMPNIEVGHANVWSTIAVDEARGLVFLPTSSPSPDYYGGNRLGDNLYANSVVALDGTTGEVKWHFQTVHHDVWDYDLSAQPGLYQVWRDGKAHDVVAQVTKTGLLFVLDRDSGEPFLPIEERPVPQNGKVAGEELSPTQPFPVATPPIVPSQLDPSNAFGITYWDKLYCKNRFEELLSEGLFTPPSEQGTLAYPFTGGGVNWGSAAFDPTRNLLVVNMSNMAAYMKLTAKTGLEASDEASSVRDDAEYAPMEGAPYFMERSPILSPLGLPCSPPPWGVIAGIDLASGEIVWRKTLGTTEDLAPGGLALKLGTPVVSGPILTASGLAFTGSAMDDYLRAFDSETGEELWKGRLPAGGQATPMTYHYRGRQYVVIAAGGHSSAGTRLGDHIIAFALPE
jgi:quinoprotein glucose dehydrogenase